MSMRLKLFVCLSLVMVAISLMPVAWSYGTGVKAYLPSQRSATVNATPFTYNGSFMAYNDGYREGVYMIRVSVTEPSTINWLDLSSPIFTLRPGESKLVYFSFNIPAGELLPGDYEFIFTPALLTANVEPYMDQFANYVSNGDAFNFTLSVPAGTSSVTAETSPPVAFLDNSNRMNLVQYSVMEDSKIVTQLDRAIKLSAPSSAVVGETVPLSLAIFDNLSDRGISLMAISPDGAIYPVSNGNYSFDKIGLWGIIVLVGDDIVIGKTVDVTAMKSPLSGLDPGAILALLSLLALLAVVPLWLATPKKHVKADPYDDIIYKANVIRKYIDRFDNDRLKHAARMLTDEYNSLASKGVRGKKDEALAAVNELETLASLE
jgi:hypothetical protein